MLLTEAEAKKKNCPFAPLGIIASAQCGEVPALWESWCGCTASKCMAWRWKDMHVVQLVRHPKTQKEARQSAEPERPADLPSTWGWCGDAWECDGEDNYWCEPASDAALRRRGYCGLAGRGR